MKTVAVMIMAFLPATATAAILAVPWERGSQTIPGLQAIIYCVVTVCMTLLVFLIFWRGATWFEESEKWLRSDERWFRGLRGARRSRNWLARNLTFP